MGLVYDSDDSQRMKAALSANLSAASSMLGTAESASRRLLSGLGAGELAGKGYSAVEALFARIVVPCLTRTKREIESVRGEYDAYVRADAEISTFGVLKEDELNTQLEATRTQRDATERLIEANSAAATSAVALPGVSEALLTKNTQLELVLTQLEKDLRELGDSVAALRAFDSATRRLFQGSITKLKSATADTVALLKQLGGTDGGSRGDRGGRTQALAFLAALDSSKDWSTATSRELSALLNDLSPSQMGTLLDAHPELLQRFWDHPPAPETTAAWWKKLDAKRRKQWADAVPRLVGNLDGVPPRVRSDANHGCLVADLAEAKKRLADVMADPDLLSPSEGRRQLAQNRLDDAQKLADTLSRISKAFGEGPAGAPPHELYVYQPGDHTKVAVSAGLLEIAEHISVIVPGMGTSASDIGDYVKAAEDMRQQQWQAGSVSRTKIAVLSWLDYDAPGSVDVWGVLHDDLAEAGAERLGNTLRGLAAVKDWPPNAAGLSVIAHSYGTDVAALALATHGVTAGHLVLLGSAGIAGSVPSAAALHVPGGEVYAAQGTSDGWAPLGQFWSGRTDPTEPGFGAHTFSAEETSLDGLELKGITKHGPFGGGPTGPGSYSYLDNLTSAQYAAAMATMGRGREIPVGGTPQERTPVPEPLPGPTPFDPLKTR